MSYASRRGSAEREHAYRALVERMRALVVAHVPAGARVLVVSRGDGSLLRLRGREGAHFPQSPTGLYAGHHPADGVEAVADLERLCADGAEHLAIPATALWWLDHYPELRVRLEEHGERLAEEPDTGVVYALRPAGAGQPRASRDELEAARTAPQVGALLRALLPDDADPVVLVGRTAAAVDVGSRRCWRLPAPGPDVTVLEVLARAEAACRDGARYVVLVNDDDPARRLDGRLRRRLEESLRPVFALRLAEAFEVESTRERLARA